MKRAALALAAIAAFFVSATAKADYVTMGFQMSTQASNTCEYIGGTIENALAAECQAAGTGQTGVTDIEAKINGAQQCVGITINCGEWSSGVLVDKFFSLGVRDNYDGIVFYYADGVPEYNWAQLGAFLTEEYTPDPCEPTNEQPTDIEIPFDITTFSYDNIMSATYVVDGCAYKTTNPAIPKCYDKGDGTTACKMTVIGLGISSAGDESPPADDEAPIALAEEQTTDYEVTESTQVGEPTDGCSTDANGIETCVETVTEYSIENLPDYLRWNPDLAVVELVNGGAKTTTTTTEVTTQTDTATGAKTETTEVTTTESDTGKTTTLISSGGSTSVTSGTSSNTSGSTSTVSYDGTGEVTSSSATTTDSADPEQEGELGTLEEASGQGGEWGDFDSEVGAWQTPVDNNNVLSTNVISMHFAGVGTACNPADYGISYMGINLDFDLCPAIEMLQDILYWAFAILTLIYLYHSWSTVLRGAS